ncbi:ABC transporter substrate-binding protein [Clostridium sp. Marseille-P299]|uniref:ABC transporter substrate-binding protein n=1 Tax=Clostridium sp. Marseille-P299 TaxID=1805477 RepID=UPI00082E4AF6|nr:ABC transporter substrate-binding protein [Clostridium sp. Marseille-P299]
MKLKKVVSSILCLTMATVLLAGCSKGGKANQTGNQADSEGNVELSQHVTLSLYLYGSAGVANADILAEINRKLTEDINTSIEIKYIDWGDIGTKYPLIWASGEEFDMAYASATTAVPFYTLAKQGSLYDITSIIDKYTPTLKEKVPASSWAATSSDGKIYGVPSLGSGYNNTGFVYNKANCKKWGISEVTDLESMIAYCDASVANGIYPFNGDANISKDFYKMLVELTGKWVPAPGISNEEMFLVTRDYNNINDIVHPAFTDEFVEFVKMLDEWEGKGYWPKDILSASTGDKEMYKNGQSSSYITHLGDWTGNYTNIHGQLQDQDIDAWYFGETTNKIMKSSPAQDITVVNANSKNAERCVMAIEKFLTDQSYYNLWQYGIEGRQYQVADGFLEKPASYDENVDAGGFAGWAFSNSEFKIPLKTEHPSRYEKMAEWSKIYLSDPYTGFSFDSSKVSTELSAISNVNSTLGIQLMLGKTDNVEAAIEEYRNQLKKAGIDTVIEELKNQLSSFTPVVTN